MFVPKLILASASSRREELLLQLGLSFEVMPQDITEKCNIGESPEKFVTRMADEKAKSALVVHKDNNKVILASDTIVVINGEVLGKPINKNESIKMLLSLSKKSHRVLSAVTVASPEKQKSVLTETVVVFREISEIEADYYWGSGEPAGKAGGYAIQGLGAVFVESIVGSYSGVVGLPLFETALLLKEFGVSSWQYK